MLQKTEVSDAIVYKMSPILCTVSLHGYKEIMQTYRMTEWLSVHEMTTASLTLRPAPSSGTTNDSWATERMLQLSACLQQIVTR